MTDEVPTPDFSEWEQGKIASLPLLVGMELIGLPEEITPLCGLAVIKALDEDGEVAYYTRATEGLSSVEALGMAHFAALRLSEDL